MKLFLCFICLTTFAICCASPDNDDMMMWSEYISPNGLGRNDGEMSLMVMLNQMMNKRRSMGEKSKSGETIDRITKADMSGMM